MCLYAENGATLLVGIWWRENNNKLVKWKALIYTVGIKGADLEENFCSNVLQHSELPRCRERPQTAMRCLEWLGRFKCLATGLDASLSFLSTSRRCSRNQSPSRLPVSPMFNFLQQVQVMQWMALAEVLVKLSVILMDLLGPDISWLYLMNERTSFAS